MRVLLLILVISIVSTTITAQNFLFKSSKWHYVNNGGMSAPNTQLKTYTYVKDTLVLGKNARLLSNGYVFYSSNDSVFYYDSGYNSFGLVYDYNASKGDTIECQVPSALQTSNMTFKSVVTDINFEVFPSGDSLRKFELNSLDPSVHFKGECYYERIGSLEFLPVLMPTIPEHFVIKCYGDSTIDAQLSYLQTSCDSLVSGIDDITEKRSATIQPNPVTDHIGLPKSSVGIVTSYTIYAMDGKIARSGPIKYNSILGLSDLPSGLYILKTFSESLNEFKVYRFAKE